MPCFHLKRSNSILFGSLTFSPPSQTPRSQRSSSDVQTWEFSHHKFLRGRPDLLEEIKRKTMDPDPSLTSLKQRLELPGEIVVQLTAMKDENRRIRKDLELERRKVSRLSTAVKTMWDMLERTFPGGCTFVFRLFPLFHFLRFPSPLTHFEPTLISSFTCALCWSGRSRAFHFDL